MDLQLKGSQIARGLAWFSLGLGLVQVLAPRHLSRWMGFKNRIFLIRLLGLREIVSGIGILTRRRPDGWLWARAGGDVLDLALLGVKLASDRSMRGRTAVATAAIAGVTVLDLLCTKHLAKEKTDRAVEVWDTITVNRSPEELYRLWRDPENAARILKHFCNIIPLEDDRTHWVIHSSGDMKFEWDMQLVEDQPGVLLHWDSTEGGDLPTELWVFFQQVAKDKTEVLLRLRFEPAATPVGDAAMKFLERLPDVIVLRALRNLKTLGEMREHPTFERS